ncbi:hypothetical protein FRC08_011324 [Ceratobasidium sp. 394]|nr:hypothetical protein FRC08_011324 [Ceratobasidium sp. 394]
MEPICACSTGSVCLIHPPPPPTPVYSATNGPYAHHATWAYPTYYGSQMAPAPPAPHSGQPYYQQPYCPPQYQTSYSFYPQEFHSGSKRSADPAPYAAATKRRRLKATAPTQGSHQYDAAALQRAQAQQAAATLPPTYYTDAHYEQSTSRARASRAIDCWYFTVGTHLNRLPASEEVATLCIADKQRTNNSAIDLRKPSAPRLRCTECLKLGIWRTWKNNDEGGVSYGIRSHLHKRHAST